MVKLAILARKSSDKYFLKSKLQELGLSSHYILKHSVLEENWAKRNLNLSKILTKILTS